MTCQWWVHFFLLPFTHRRNIIKMLFLLKRDLILILQWIIECLYQALTILISIDYSRRIPAFFSIIFTCPEWNVFMRDTSGITSLPLNYVWVFFPVFSRIASFRMLFRLFVFFFSSRKRVIFVCMHYIDSKNVCCMSVSTCYLFAYHCEFNWNTKAFSTFFLLRFHTCGKFV